MGLDPVGFLAVPKIVAATAAMPVLTIFAELAGLAGGALVLELLGVPVAAFWRHVVSSAGAFAIAFGLAKATLFGFLVAIVGCGAGISTRNTSDGVGVAATSAVVGGIVAIAVSDGILAVLCWIWNL